MFLPDQFTENDTATLHDLISGTAGRMDLPQ